MLKTETYLVMVVTDSHGKPYPDDWIKYWKERLIGTIDKNGKYIARYSYKEVARADARKFSSLTGYPYKAVRA